MLKFKLRRTLRGNIKAVSPVIATIIIVAVAITMSIAVAYWLLGLGGSFTRFEKVEFITGYASVDATGDYVVALDVKNTGSATATIDSATILYNGKPGSGYDPHTPDVTFDPATTDGLRMVMEPGDDGTIEIILYTATDDGPDATPDTADDITSPWKSGMTVEVLLHTSGGKDYPKAIILP